MDPGTFQIILATAMGVLVGAVGWLIKTVISNTRRVAVLEARDATKELWQELSKVREHVDSGNATVNRLDGEVSQMNVTLSMIQQHLMGSGDE